MLVAKVDVLSSMSSTPDNFSFAVNLTASPLFFDDDLTTSQIALKIFSYAFLSSAKSVFI